MTGEVSLQKDIHAAVRRVVAHTLQGLLETSSGGAEQAALFYYHAANELDVLTGGAGAGGYASPPIDHAECIRIALQAAQQMITALDELGQEDARLSQYLLREATGSLKTCADYLTSA